MFVSWVEVCVVRRCERLEVELDEVGVGLLREVGRVLDREAGVSRGIRLYGYGGELVLLGFGLFCKMEDNVFIR